MIILLGFPKSGTTSFHELFTTLGFQSHHWIFEQPNRPTQYIGTLIKNNKLHGRKLLSFIDKKDYDHTCLTQMDICLSSKDNYWPQITDYRRLYKENPNAIFILNKRPLQNLLNSFKNWNQLALRLITHNPTFFKTTKIDDRHILIFFQHHYNKIERFFSRRPTAKFITFDIENDSLTKLEPYIDLKGISQLPRANQSNVILKKT